MELLLGCGIFFGLLSAVYLGGRWILGPIDRAAKGRRAPARISISDFLCLFVAVQLPLTFASRLRSEETEAFFWMLAGLSWVIAPVIWISCARALSRAGITGGIHRFLFMGLVLPVVYYGLIPFLVSGLIGVTEIAFGRGRELMAYWWSIVAWICTGVALVACGLYTNWLCRMRGHNRAGDSPLREYRSNTDADPKSSESVSPAS